MSVEDELVGKIQGLMRKRYNALGPDARRQFFADYDTNKDGQISADELSQVLSDADIGNFMTRSMWVKGVMAKLDLDQDGTLSFEEFESVIPASPEAETAETD
ncbi:MAG: Ca2+-binding EF-hand superfamily protein [Myxococcota bacterium]|jgi:Ca2+-binding EF-hand superfamily protein